MQIGDQKVVTLHYTLTDNDGKVIDKSEDGSFAYLHGASNIIPGLEDALTGKSAGEEMSVSVSPEQAYGVRDEAMLQQVPKNMFEDASQIAVGTQFHAQGPNGEMLVVTVMQVEEEHVIVDGNHPLAGVELNFDVKIIDVRDASEEEVEHGHVHAPGGHHH
ncbi:MAG: peptidylprolyl isomerase [Gammaproteobacteria bacterium]|nr:peptidylprolyl isomerase [Gammaproteobacteria bacterium]